MEKSLPPLQKGQVWNMPNQQLLIYHKGIHLVEFRIFPNGERPRKLPKSSLERVDTVQSFLERNAAVLQAKA